MDLQKMLVQQQSKKHTPVTLEQKTMSVDDYLKDENAPRPYNIRRDEKDNVDLKIKPSENKKNSEPLRKNKVSKKKITPTVSIKKTSSSSDTINYNDIVYSLYGIKKNLIEIFVRRCIENGDNNTGKITRKYLFSEMKASQTTIVKNIDRLKEDNLIRVKISKRGNGGFTVFELDQELIDAMKLALRYENNNPSTIIDKEYLEKTGHKIDCLISEWDNIDISPLKNINFKKTHLVQLQHKNIPEVVSESILHFAWGLENNPKTKKYAEGDNDPLNILMGVLRKGEAWTESKYVNPKDLALKNYLKRKEQESAERNKIFDEIYNLEFPIWKENLTDKEVKDIYLAKGVLDNALSGHKKSAISSYFKEKVLPKIMEGSK